jgi:tetratricopeptide (TPR) repeat protein
LKKILEVKEDYAPALLTLASTEMARGHLDEAETYYQRVHPLDPSRGEAVQGLGNLALRRKLVAGGELPPSIAPESAQVLEALEKKGLSHIAEGQLIAARETFAALLRRASAAREKSMQVKALRALSGIEEGFSRFPESEQCLRWALDLDPLDAEAWLRLGDFLLRRTQDRTGARVAYERYLANLARDKAPEPRVWLNLATLLRGENVPLAIEYAEKARRAGLEDPRIIDRLLGYLHAESGSWQRSLDFFNRYLESAPPGIDAEREAVRIFVRDRVLPHCLEP